MAAATLAARVEGHQPRILIIDDSAVARAALSTIVADSGRFVVAAALPDSRRALTFLAAERVDIILLDLELPQTSGIEALPAIIAAGRGARVLIVSSSAEEGAEVTIRALALGAADTLVKPIAGGVADFAATLLMRLEVLSTATDRQGIGAVVAPRTVTLPAFDVIAVGASTGGIHAFASLLATLPARVTQPIVATQHLPSTFSSYFAAQLAVSGRRPCTVAVDRSRVVTGEIVIAPGDAHLVVSMLPSGTAAIRLSTAPAPTGNLPSVDPMLESLAVVYGPRLLAVVLSGMGRDGLIGARAVRDAGGTVIVQDRDTSVVWGMPGAVARAGLANAVAPPEQLGELIAASAAA